MKQFLHRMVFCLWRNVICRQQNIHTLCVHIHLENVSLSMFRRERLPHKPASPTKEKPQYGIFWQKFCQNRKMSVDCLQTNGVSKWWCINSFSYGCLQLPSCHVWRVMNWTWWASSVNTLFSRFIEHRFFLIRAFEVHHLQNSIESTEDLVACLFNCSCKNARNTFIFGSILEALLRRYQACIMTGVTFGIKWLFFL